MAMTKKEKLREIFQRLKSGEVLHVLTEKGQQYQGTSLSMEWNTSYRDSYLYYSSFGYGAHKATLAYLQYELDVAGSYDVETDKEFEARTGQKFFYWGLW